MERKSYLFKLISGYLTLFLFTSCCWFDPDSCEDCYDSANLIVPQTVTNMAFEQTYNPTYIGNSFYLNGAIVGPNETSTMQNKLFAVTRNEGGVLVTYFWNDHLYTPLTGLYEGETITLYFCVANIRNDNAIDCIFQTPQSVETVLEYEVRTEDGEIVGERTVTQTAYEIPSGQYYIYKFDFEYLGCAAYDFNISIDPSGSLNEVNTEDNNYSQGETTFCF